MSNTSLSTQNLDIFPNFTVKLHDHWISVCKVFNISWIFSSFFLPSDIHTPWYTMGNENCLHISGFMICICSMPIHDPISQLIWPIHCLHGQFSCYNAILATNNFQKNTMGTQFPVLLHCNGTNLTPIHLFMSMSMVWSMFIQMIKTNDYYGNGLN